MFNIFLNELMNVFISEPQTALSCSFHLGLLEPDVMTELVGSQLSVTV